MSKSDKLILPPGTAVFPKLNEVDVYRPKGGGQEKRQFITYVRYEPKVLKDVQAMIAEWAKANGAKKGIKLPFKELKSKTGDPEIVLKAASGEKYRPALFDARNKPIPVKVKIGGGSIIKVKVSPSIYDGFGGGVNLYLDQVQVLKLVAGDNSVSSFEEAEGWSYEGDDDEAGETSGFGATGGEDDSNDDALTL